MSDNDTVSIVHKKARVAREDFDLRAMSPAKALRLSLARCADDMFDLAVVIKTLEQTRIKTNDLPEELNENGMLMLLDGATGKRGVAWCDGNFVSAVVEQQISGQVRSGDTTPRTYTRTDAAMLAPLLDATLEGFDAKLGENDPGHISHAFRFGDRVEDTRALSLALEAGRYDMFKLVVDIAEGARSGVFILVLPEPVAAPKTSADKAPGSSSKMPGLETIALDATIALTTVIARLHHPLNAVFEFEPGMVLPLPVECLSQAELVARPGHLVAEVQLGQSNGMRAVRLHMNKQDTRQDGARSVAKMDEGTMPETPHTMPELPEIPALAQTDALDDLPFQSEPPVDLPDNWEDEEDLPDFDLPLPAPVAQMPGH